MPLEFIESQKGKQLLVHLGFLYSMEKCTESKKIWKCVEYASNKCKGRCHTQNDEVTWFSQNHNHTPHSSKIEAKRSINSIKCRAVETMETPQQIISSEAVAISSSVAAALPPIPYIKRTIQRKRKSSSHPLPSPTSLRTLHIPDDYTKTVNEENFLLFDSGPSDNRILVFGTQKNLEMMSSCPSWFADGTFKVVPPLFSQLYTIHGINYSSVIPSVFALLADRREETYVRLLHALINLHPSLSPVSIMTDFEMAAMNAFKEVFPSIISHGCFFHFCQSIWRHLQSFHDIRVRYEDTNDPDFALQIRQLGALAYVPPHEVIRCYEVLTDSDFFRSNEEMLLPLLDYFEDTWIGRLNRVGERRNPRFAIELWNTYESTLNNMPRTNNSVEGWHRSFSSLVNSNHPSIWKFIECLKKEQATNEMKIEQCIAGMMPQSTKKVYRDTAARILSIVRNYHVLNTLDYLRGIAHNFQLQAS